MAITPSGTRTYASAIPTAAPVERVSTAISIPRRLTPTRQSTSLPEKLRKARIPSDEGEHLARKQAQPARLAHQQVAQSSLGPFRGEVRGDHDERDRNDQ